MDSHLCHFLDSTDARNVEQDAGKTESYCSRKKT